MEIENEFMKKVANEMSSKFQIYPSEYSMNLGIAVVMDPRFKMRFVEWAYKILYGVGSSQFVTFRDTLKSLYEAYVVRRSTETCSRDQTHEARSSSEDALFQEFDSSYKESTSSSVKNELTSYLDDKNLGRKLELDILDWWKNQQYRYPVLSRLASDVLTIPVSIVASESAFCAGGRVLDEYHSSLSSETVEELLCVRDWLYEKKCEESSIMDILPEDVLDLNIDQRI